MLTLALQGFHDARRRHDSDRLTADATRVFISAAECVYWASTMDERLRDWPGYASFTSSHPIGLLLPGVRYVRNLKTHRLPMTLERIEGARFPVVFPMVFAEVVWLPLDKLPPPGQTTKYTPKQESSYAAHMAGFPTRHIFHQLADGFSDLEAFPESPLSA